VSFKVFGTAVQVIVILEPVLTTIVGVGTVFGMVARVEKVEVEGHLPFPQAFQAEYRIV
jgi:hypothetical protein